MLTYIFLCNHLQIITFHNLKMKQVRLIGEEKRYLPSYQSLISPQTVIIEGKIIQHNKNF